MREIMVKKKLNLMFVLVFAYFGGCMDVPDDLIAPEWDTEFNLPLLKKTYTLDDIIKEQPHITIDTSDTNIYLLRSDKYYLNTNLSDFVDINDESFNNISSTTSNSDSDIVYVAFPGGIEIDSAEFDDGVIDFGATNPSPENATIIIAIPGFRDKDGNSPVLRNEVPSGQSNFITQGLAGYTYVIPPDQPVELRNSLRLIVRAESPQEGNSVYSDVSISEVSFHYMTGKILSKSLGDQTSSYLFGVDDPEEYRGKTSLRDAKLNLNAYYVSMFNTPVDLEIKDLNIIAKRNNGSEFYLKDKSGNSNFTIRIINGESKRVFTKDNSNVNEFVAFFPDSVILKAEYIVNPENDDGTYSDLDSIKFETDFSTRSYLAIKQTNINEQTAIELSQSDRDEIEKGKSAEVKFEIDNGIPLTAWLKVDLSDENNNYLFTLTNSLEGSDSISFGGAEVDQNGEVISSYENPPKPITLDGSQIQLLSKAYYLNYSVSFTTKDAYLNPPQIVAVRPSDWIKLKAYGKVRYKVSFSD
jgi:hypothetical protein